MKIVAFLQACLAASVTGHTIFVQLAAGGKTYGKCSDLD